MSELASALHVIKMPAELDNVSDVGSWEFFTFLLSMLCLSLLFVVVVERWRQ